MKIDFSSENKIKRSDDYPKLMLEAGERARIVCVEAQPTVGFVHTIKGPQLVNGEVVYKDVRQKDGTYKSEMQYDFIGRHMCFGNPEKLFENGKDPANCPTCATTNENDDLWNARAQRSFAMHIIRYKTQPNSFKVQTPFQAELLAWRFSNKVYDSLVDIAEEHGDLRKKDLNLGPCINKMYQNYDIQVGSDAIWLQSEETQTLVKSIYAENKSEDLSPLIARKISKETAAEDVDKMLQKFAIAKGAEAAPAASYASAESTAGANMDLDSLLKDDVAAPSPAPAVEPEGAAAPTTAPDPEPVQSDTDVVAPSTPAETPSEPEKKSAPLDFESLLEGL